MHTSPFGIEAGFWVRPGSGLCPLLGFFACFPTGVSDFLISGPEVETPGAIQLFFFAFVVSVFVGLVPVL